jgi:SM-20-related protein
MIEEQEIFEQLDFTENPLYEAIIANLLSQQYAVVDHFFDDTEVVALRNSLQENYESRGFKKSAIGNWSNEEVDKSIRGDYISWINEKKISAAEELFFFKINDLIDYLNKTCFLGIIEREFHYAIYPTGTFYKRHLDTFKNDDRRKLSMVCYLNDANWPASNGGELTLYLADGAKNILPLPGRVVLFESQMIEHEVKVVKSSERLSITGWLKTR